jgi:hypothetical protein
VDDRDGRADADGHGHARDGVGRAENTIIAQLK